MSTYNRSRLSQYDTDEGDPDFLLSPCFQIDRNVELKDVPTTGEEYLLKVMKERQNCEPTATCKIDLSQFANKQSFFTEGPPVTKSAPEALKPTTEWQLLQVSDFSDTRMYISRMRADRSKWPKRLKSQSNKELNDFVIWKQLFDDQPTLSNVIGLSQNNLDTGLEVLISILNKIDPGESISEHIGQWIYAFLACINLPLVSDTVNILRNLARKCAEIRSHLKSNDVLAAAPLNIFICLVSRYFEQTDLKD